jgi:Spy/CpxP family protein refolding chaperone
MSKKSSILTFVLALLVGLTVPRIMAQTGTAAVDPETRAQVQEKLQHISSELNLSDDQKQQLKPILQSEFQQLKAVKDDASLSPDQKQSKAQEIQQNAKSQMATILTPDQQKKLQSMKEGSEPK